MCPRIHVQADDIVAKAKRTKREIDLTQFQKRLADVTERLQKLESRVSALEGTDADETEFENKRRPGPRPKIEDEEFFERRDAFVIGLESSWGELEPRLLTAGTPQDVRAVRETITPSMPISEQMKGQITATSDQLFEFLKSGRMIKTVSRATIGALRRETWDQRSWEAAAKLPTRQLANAIAGAPELSWSRSLDRCSKLPCRWPVREASELLFGIILEPRLQG